MPVKNELNKYKYLEVVPIDKVTVTIAFVCKRFYAFAIVKELGLHVNSSTDTYDKINKWYYQ